MPIALSILKAIVFAVVILLVGQIPVRGTPVAAQFHALVASVCQRGVKEVTSAPWYASVSQFSLNPTLNAKGTKTPAKAPETAPPPKILAPEPAKPEEAAEERIEKTPISTLETLPKTKTAIDDSHIQEVTPADRESLLRLLE